MTEIIVIAIKIDTITEFRKCVFDQLLIKEKENLGQPKQTSMRERENTAQNNFHKRQN